MAMPPKAAPAPQQAPQDEEDQAEGPEEQGQEQGGGGSVTDMILQVNDGLSKLAAIVGKAQVPPQVKDQLGQSLQLFQAAVQGLSGKGGQAPADSGVSSMEAGGSSKAVPAM